MYTSEKSRLIQRKSGSSGILIAEQSRTKTT
jgi:hypothetical protein